MGDRADVPERGLLIGGKSVLATSGQLKPSCTNVPATLHP
jgi:hypothetical protein